MKKNIGSTERWIRGIIGIGALAAGAGFGSWWGLVGLIPLGTAFIGWCPPYAACGISTKHSGS